MKVVAEGWADELGLAESVELGLAEGSEVEFQAYFSYRFPFFSEIAGAFQATLMEGGVTPWGSGAPLVEANANLPIWHIRYVKGLAWLGVFIIAALLALTVATLFYFWRMLVKVAKVVKQILVGSALSGLALVVVAMASKRPRRPSYLRG